MTSTMRLVFSSRVEVITMLPLKTMNIYSMKHRIKARASLIPWTTFPSVCSSASWLTSTRRMDTSASVEANTLGSTPNCSIFRSLMMRSTCEATVPCTDIGTFSL